MSKSLGNFVTINELLHTENFGGRKWPGEVLRLAMLRTHYRQPIDFTVKALEEAEASLRKWSAQIGEVSADPAASSEALSALADDLNTPLALASLHELDAAALDGALKLVGIDIRAYRQWVEGETSQAVDAEEVSSLISTRLAARAAKNWAESDRIRDELAAMGVALKDNKDGTTTWEVKR
jgi:cysteinyl-tRNA synthetase